MDFFKAIIQSRSKLPHSCKIYPIPSAYLPKKRFMFSLFFSS